MKPHPTLETFRGLYRLRDHIKSNPEEVTGIFANFCAANYLKSHAQLFQDLLVLFLLRGKQSGYFVEFGATDGVYLSNTKILESNFHWKGVLAEPAHCWHDALTKNRSAAIDKRCVWSSSGSTIMFKQAKEAELSTVASFISHGDAHAERRENGGDSYPVETISLNDLLKFHNSPQEIDYLSIDTEGSELSILEEFNLDRYDVGIITVEHNFVEDNRKAILDLLTARNYIRIFPELSDFDDWYVKKTVVGLK